MPALNEAQRKRQRMLQKQREEAYAASMRAKPGQKGQQTGAQGAASKGETIGGAPQRIRVKNPVKSRQLTADEARTPKVEAGKGDPEFRRPKPAEKKPAKPVMRAAQQPTTATTAPVAKPAPAKPKAPETRKPLSEMGSVSGSKFEGGPSANEKLTIGKTKYEGDVTPGVKADGTDMERRRAFLDADDSIKGIKAVRELLKKRKEAQRIKGG